MNQFLTRRKALSLIAGMIGIFLAKRLFATDKRCDVVTNAKTTATVNLSESNSSYAASSVLLILVSFHHKNTEKIANAIADALKAEIRSPKQIDVEDLQKYDLIGFGSGIYDQKHHKSVLDLVDKLPMDAQMKVFIYSTSGITRKACLKHSIDDPHKVIREKLLLKKCKIIDEFNCAGWNTNSFLKLAGGINKGKPDSEDLKQAKEFAISLHY